MRLVHALRATAASAGVTLAVAACLSPRPAAEPRYFTPIAQGAQSDAPANADGPMLRVRRVRAAPYLRDRMVWRRGAEVGFYDMLRWTETPARFARSALEDELFERRGFRRSSSALVPALDAHLEAFDELLAPTHEALVTLAVVVSDPSRGTLVDRTVEVRRPIASDDPKAVADALGEALTAAAREVGEAVTQATGARPL